MTDIAVDFSPVSHMPPIPSDLALQETTVLKYRFGQKSLFGTPPWVLWYTAAQVQLSRGVVIRVKVIHCPDTVKQHYGHRLRIRQASSCLKIPVQVGSC